MNSDFQLSEHDFETTRQRPFDYKLWQRSQDELHPENTGRFLVTSIFLHGLIALFAFAASLQMFEDKKNEPVEIELLNAGEAMPLAQALSQGPAAEAALPMAPEPIPAAAPQKADKDDVAVAAPPAKSIPAAPTPKANKPSVSSATKAAPKMAMAPVQTYQTESPVVLPDSVDDIQDPQLSETAVAPINPNEIEDDDDLKKDFAKVDHHQKKQIQALAQDLEEQNKEALSETEKVAEQISQDNEAEGEKIAAFNASQRARDAQAIAAANAAERAAAAKAAQEAREARAAQAAKAAAALAAQEKAGKGSGESTSDAISGGAASGSPTGVRDAQDLRQKPGNPLPRYESKERLLGHQGKVVFLAYVTPEGVPLRFKLTESTGHKNLDGKTLKALKQWRFYPGQEGWVEMAFNWTLTGGAQEMPALLKRSR